MVSRRRCKRGSLLAVVLKQLDQNAMRSLGVHKGHSAMSASTRRLVNQRHLVGFETIQCCLNVLHLDTDMMDALAALIQELGNARVVTGVLHQLNIALANRQEGDLYLLVRDPPNLLQRKSQCLLIDFQGFLDVVHHNSDMINLPRFPPRACVCGPAGDRDTISTAKH